MVNPSLPPVAPGRLATFLGCRRISWKGLGTREIDAGKQRRACEPSCDYLLHETSIMRCYLRLPPDMDCHTGRSV